MSGEDGLLTALSVLAGLIFAAVAVAWVYVTARRAIARRRRHGRRRRRRHDHRPVVADVRPCPACLSSNVGPSRIRWYDWPALLLLLKPRRCGHCMHRFRRF